MGLGRQRVRVSRSKMILEMLEQDRTRDDVTKTKLPITVVRRFGLRKKKRQYNENKRIEHARSARHGTPSSRGTTSRHSLASVFFANCTLFQDPRVRGNQAFSRAGSHPPTRGGNGLTARAAMYQQCADSETFHGWILHYRGRAAAFSLPVRRVRNDAVARI
jgi:hypothetical protein